MKAKGQAAMNLIMVWFTDSHMPLNLSQDCNAADHSQLGLTMDLSDHQLTVAKHVAHILG